MKKSIKGTAKISDVFEGTITLKYDKDIVKWFKQFNEDDCVDVNYANYGDLQKQIGKLLGVTVEESFYDYWDYHYTHFMDFFVDIEFAEITDKAIKQALKGKIFTIKLKIED